MILTLTHGVQFERFRDGFAIDGQRYIDPEGKITSDGFDAQSGDLAYLAETRPGESLVKVGRALSNADPMTIATAQKQGALWQVTTVTGKKFNGDRLMPSSRGCVMPAQYGIPLNSRPWHDDYHRARGRTWPPGSTACPMLPRLPPTDTCPSSGCCRAPACPVSLFLVRGTALL